MKKLSAFAIVAVFMASALPQGVEAAMQIRKKTDSAPAAAPAEKAPPPAKPSAPAPSPAPAAKEEAPKRAAQPSAPPPAAEPAKQASPEITKESFCGSVEFMQGKLAMIASDDTLAPKQRLVAYDSRLQKKGILKVTATKAKDVYVATVTAGSVSVGDRLVKETEEEAFRRVQRTKRVATVKEFLEIYPESQHRDEAALKLFRLRIRSEFPVEGGTEIGGQITLTEKVSQKIGLSRAMIKLDRFIIATTDEEGMFKISGVPAISLPVKLRLSVVDEKFAASGDNVVELPADKASTISQNIEVKLTPTNLAGTVVDEKGQPLRGVQVWTSPYTMEKLTDEKGEFKIGRKKRLDDSGNPQEGDEPLLGRDYEVYAYKQGYGAEKVAVSAKSFKENQIKEIKLLKQSATGDNMPALDISLRENLDLMQYVVSAGAGPKINR